VRTRLRSHGWTAFLVVMGALAVPYLAFHGTAINSGPVFNLFGAASVAAILVSARINRTARFPWILIAIGQAAFVAGDVLAYNYQRFFGKELPFPSIADVFYLATYPFLIAGLLLLIRKRTPTQDRASLIDTLIVTTASGALVWAGLIAPYAHDATLSVATKLTSIAYPVMDLGVLACVIRFAIGRGRRPIPFYLLTTATVSLFVTDSIYGWLLLHGGYETGGLLDAGWIAFYLLAGAAALHPRMPHLAEPTPDTQFRLTYRRIASLAACSLAAPALLIARSASGGSLDTILLASCAAAGFLLVIARLLDLVKRHELALLRATVLAEAGAQLVQENTRGGVVDAALHAARRITGPGSDVRFEEGDPAEAGSGAVLLRLQGRNELRGTLVVRTAGEGNADVLAALQTLGNEVAMALDGVAMADDLLRERTDARFRSLVQNASDVILLIDGSGRIGFASPSADRVFGYDLDELVGEQLVSIISEGDRTKVAHAVLGENTSASIHGLEFVLEAPRGTVEVEATCTNLLDDENVGGIVLNIRDVTERKSFERQLAHQAFHDEVTGLANRALFRDRVEHALTRAVREPEPLSILFIDVDDFKTVNDTLGHVAGDSLLTTIGDRIAGQLRAADTAARLGGDEFAVLLEDAGSAAAAQTAERLLAAISQPVELEGQELSVTASVGIAEVMPGVASSADELLRHADVAMYAAKEHGKGHYKIFEAEMHYAVIERLALKRALQGALDREEFELHYQPIVDLRSGAMVFIEALLRWRHPERGLVSPGDFVPLAEETGLIVPIGEWVLEQATAEAVHLIELVGGDAPAISVNLSGRQLQRPELVGDVKAIVQKTGLPPEKLILEITETVMMEDLDFALIRLQELKSHGIRLAIDDFGSGYSSLNYIRKFPIDILKVDRSFTAGVDRPGEVASLTRTIIELGSILNMVPVAEGIEEERQLSELKDMNCPLGQGYLFMRPAPAAEIEAAIVEAARGRRRGLRSAAR
jgi:diguanylate cyclase (GGDEF)-like protein/PAS domain S-box-containing protein